MTNDEALKMALEALEDRTSLMKWQKAISAIREALAQQDAEAHLQAVADFGQEQEPVLQDIEQYRMQMAGISTAALGYWKDGDGIHPDYDTVELRDVAKLYAKYDALYKARWAAQTEQEPVAWWDAKLGVFDEKQFDQLQPLYTSPPKREWVGLTDEEVIDCFEAKVIGVRLTADAIRQAVAALKEKNNGI